MAKTKRSALTIILIIFAIVMFLNAWGYEPITPRLLWDALIFIFIFMAILSWKIDKLVRKNVKK